MKGGLQPPAPSRLPATSGRQRPIYGWLAGFVAGALAMWLVSSQTAALHTFGGQHSSFLIGPRGASGSGNLSSGGSTARSSWRWISATENDPEQVNGVSRNFQTAAAQSMLPALQQRLAQAALEQRWRLDPPPRGAPAGAPPADDPLRIPRILHHGMAAIPGLLLVRGGPADAGTPAHAPWSEQLSLTRQAPSPMPLQSTCQTWEPTCAWQRT